MGGVGERFKAMFGDLRNGTSPPILFSLYYLHISGFFLSIHLQLFTNQEHPDAPLLEHVKELVANLDALGIGPTPIGEDEDDEEEGNGEDWEDEDGDVDMS